MDRNGQGSGTILVGIIIDGSSIGWGQCEAFSLVNSPHFQGSFSIDKGILCIEETIGPALVGQKATSFRDLASPLASLRERASIKKPIPQPEAGSAGVSRRAIISGFLAAEEDDAAAQVEEVEVERAIHPSIRHGVSQALLAAMAMIRGQTATQVLVEEFDLPSPRTAVALQMPVRRGQRLQLHEQISTLAYAVDGADPEASLGANGERIQRFVRRLQESLATVEGQRQMTIHLDVAGGLGRLFDEDVGKILGALYGLEKAAAPCLIRVQDPVIMTDLDEQNEIWGQLRDYMRMRGMALQLVASAGISTLADVETLAQAGAAHLLRLRMPQLGGIQELMAASQLCRAHDVGILLEEVPSAMNSQVALAIQPDVLTYPISWPAEMSIATFQNEMARTVAWLTQGPA